MDFKSYFISKYPEEAVGYFKNGEFFPIDNIASGGYSKDDAWIECEDNHIVKQYECVFDGAILIKKPDCIIHSHTYDSDMVNDPRIPSITDMENQRLTAIEWALVATDGKICSDPVYWGNPYHRPPIKDREFIFNIQDCLSLVQDWYYETFKILLPDHPRSADWDSKGHSYMDDLYKVWGFSDIPINEIRQGDILMMRFLSRTTNHVAIVLDNSHLLHHAVGQVPLEEPIHKYLGNKNRIVRAVRHRELI